MGNFGEKHLWSKEFKPEAVIVEKVCKLTRRILLLVGKPFNQNWPGVELVTSGKKVMGNCWLRMIQFLYRNAGFLEHACTATDFEKAYMLKLNEAEGVPQ